MDTGESVPLCPATKPNRYGNRKGHCSCSLPIDHDGDHLCQSACPCQWATDTARFEVPDVG